MNTSNVIGIHAKTAKLQKKSKVEMAVMIQ